MLNETQDGAEIISRRKKKNKKRAEKNRGEIASTGWFREREIGKKSRPLGKTTDTLLKLHAQHYVIAAARITYSRVSVTARGP